MSRVYEMTAGAVIDAEGRTVVNGVVSIYDAETGGTLIAPSVLRQGDGSAWPIEGVKTDSNGKVKALWPDSAGAEPDRLFADTARGRWPMVPADLSARVADLEESGGAGLTEDQAAVIETAARVVGGVLVDPDGDPVEVGAEVTAESITDAGGILAADAAELAADGTIIDLTTPGAGAAKAIPHTARFALNGDGIDVDGNGDVVWELTDGREVTFTFENFVLAGGGAVDTGKPGAPTGLTATPGEEQVTLSWTAPTDTGTSAISDYNPQYRIGSGAWTPFAHAASTATTRVITGLTADTPYEFRVKAHNASGDGPPTSPTASATPTGILSLSQHDTFDRADAGIIGASTDGYSWDITPLPNRDADPSGATASSVHTFGIRDNHLATISQPGGGANLASRTAPNSTDAPGGYHVRWKIPTPVGGGAYNPFALNVKYVGCFVDDQNFLYVDAGVLHSMVGGTISSLGDATGYGANPGMVVGLEVSADRTQARLRVDAGTNEFGSWPPSIRAWGTIPVGLRASRTAGILSALLGGGTLPRLLVDEFWIAPVAP